jgi:hypothetical protein
MHSVAALHLLSLHANDAETHRYAIGMLALHMEHVPDSIDASLEEVRDLRTMGGTSPDWERAIVVCSRALNRALEALPKGT